MANDDKSIVAWGIIQPITTLLLDCVYQHLISSGIPRDLIGHSNQFLLIYEGKPDTTNSQLTIFQRINVDAYIDKLPSPPDNKKAKEWYQPGIYEII